MLHFLHVFPKSGHCGYKNICSKNFLWHYFLGWHHRPLVPQVIAWKMGISIFSNIVMSALSGKLISSRSRKRLEMGSEKAPETLQRSTKVQRFIYVHIYTYVYICAWQVIFSFVQSFSWWSVCAFFGMYFFSNYIYWYCIWNHLFILN